MHVRGIFRHFALFFVCLVFKEATNLCSCFDANADAKKIVDSKFDPKVVATILPYRTQKQCCAINQAVASLNNGKPLVDPKYKPLAKTKPYDDLVFALVNEPMTVFAKYLEYYLNLKNQDYITMIYIQITDREKFKEVYDSLHEEKLEDACGKQQEFFATALKVWIEANRKDSDNPVDNPDDQGIWLGQDRHNWDKNKSGLEGMLMKHTISYAKKGLASEESTFGPIINDIKKYVDDTERQNLYIALVNYIKNESTYLAEKLHDHSDGKDNFALWVLVLTTRRLPKQIKALDQAFQDSYEGVTVRDFILEAKSQYNTTQEMLAALIDPTYIPGN